MDTELRTRLESLAVRTAPPPQDADELAATVAARVRDRRRRQWAAAAVGAVAAAVLVAVPAIRSGGPDSDPAAPSTPTGVYTTPTRGTLAGDVAFVEGLRRRPWTTHASDSEVRQPPLDTRRVVYAAQFDDARWALVAGAAPAGVPRDEGADPADLDELGSVAIAWFTGPRYAEPEEMRVYGEPRIVDSDEPVAMLTPTVPHGAPATSFVIVVGAPGDRVEVSFMRLIEPDGEITRRFGRVQTLDGIAVIYGTQVDASIDRALRYRVLRNGAEFTGLPETERAPDFVPPAVDLTRLRPAPPPAPGDAAIGAAVDEFLSRLGGWTSFVDFTVVWAGDLPMRDGGTARLSVVAAQVQGGAVWVTGSLGWGAGAGFSALACGSEIRPAGAALDQQVFVIRCGDTDQALPTSSLVVVAPPGMSAAQAWSSDEELVGGFPLSDGVAVVPIPVDLASVAVIGADGEAIDERAPMGKVDWGP